MESHSERTGVQDLTGEMDADTLLWAVHQLDDVHTELTPKPFVSLYTLTLQQSVDNLWLPTAAEASGQQILDQAVNFPMAQVMLFGLARITESRLIEQFTDPVDAIHTGVPYLDLPGGRIGAAVVLETPERITLAVDITGSVAALKHTRDDERLWWFGKPGTSEGQGTWATDRDLPPGVLDITASFALAQGAGIDIDVH
jgi:hypothetical protein